MIHLNILDQSPIPQGSTAKEALNQTVQLAQAAEQLGYKRFWVSEHHLESLAHSSPEILIAHLAAKTSHIRVGSGGVMLPHYSAYKVAEQFRLLEALYPNRIDLGIGRAPGGIPLATQALQENRTAHVDQYPQQIADLIYYFNGSVDENHRFTGLKAMPDIDTSPQIWVLGSSGGSAQLAANLGVSFGHAQFISGLDGENSIRSYQQRFQPSVLYDEPKSMVGLFMVCAETDEEAEKQASVMDLMLLNTEQGKTSGIPSIEEAQKAQFSLWEEVRIRENRNRMLVGSPSSIKRKLQHMNERYGTEEFVLATMTPDLETKIKGYELLAQVFEKVE